MRGSYNAVVLLSTGWAGAGSADARMKETDGRSWGGTFVQPATEGN